MNSPSTSRVTTTALDSTTTSAGNYPPSGAAVVLFALPILESSRSSLTNVSNQIIQQSENSNHRIIRSATSKSFKNPHQLKTAAAAAVAAHHYTKNKKAFRILCLVTCTLIVFWMPWIISWPVQAYCNCLPRFFYALTYWLEYLNSLVNSIILIVFNQHFRKKFLSIFFNFK